MANLSLEAPRTIFLKDLYFFCRVLIKEIQNHTEKALLVFLDEKRLVFTLAAFVGLHQTAFHA